MWWLLRTYRQHIVADVKRRDMYGAEWEALYQNLVRQMSGRNDGDETAEPSAASLEDSNDQVLAVQFSRLSELSRLNLRVKEAAQKSLSETELDTLHRLFAGLHAMYTLRCVQMRPLRLLARRSGFFHENKHYRQNLFSLQIYGNAEYALLEKRDVRDITSAAYPFDDQGS